MLVTSQAAMLQQIGSWMLLYQGWYRLKSLSTRCSLEASNRSRRSVTSVLQAVTQVPPRGQLYTLQIQRVSSSICSQREHRSRLINVIFQLLRESLLLMYMHALPVSSRCARQKSPLCQLYVNRIQGFLYGSQMAIILNSIVARSLNSGTMTLSLLFCMLY